MKFGAHLTIVLGACAMLLCAGASGAPVPETAEEIEDCVRDNLPQTSSSQIVLFRARDRVGSTKDSRATILWKKFPDGYSKVLMRVSQPPRLRDTGLLLVEKEEKSDRFLYLPALDKVRRITKNSSSAGFLDTDFTYEDLERIQGMRQDRQSERLEDGEVDGTAVYVVQSRPSEEDDSEFERVVDFVDREKCVLLKVEYYEEGDRLRKILTIDPEHVTRVDGALIPRRMTMEDLLEESSTELTVEEIEVDPNIPDRRFSRKELAVGGR